MADNTLIMKLALVLNTYDRPDALAAVLRSIRRQTTPPDEIVVGDDGSGPETAAVIDDARRSGLDIIHEWRPHDGFRLARMRNCALARLSSDYAVFIDGDLLLHPKFVHDHKAAARPGYFVQGKRALLGEWETKKALARDFYRPSLFTPGIDRKRHLVRLPFLARLATEVDHLRGIRGCNLAVWMDDIRRINGFNEDFIGYGREDDDFVARLSHCGIKRLNLRFAGIGCHLHHPVAPRDRFTENAKLVELTREQRAVRCIHGLDSHLAALADKEEEAKPNTEKRTPA